MLLAILLFGCTVASAETAPTARLEAVITIPATNMDGTPLTDLATVRLWIRTAPIPTCPPTGAYRTVSGVTVKPGATVTRTYSGFAWGTLHYARAAAVDLAGNVGPCSPQAEATTNQPGTASLLLRPR